MTDDLAARVEAAATIDDPRRLVEGYERAEAFVRTALEDGREPLPDWRYSIHNAVQEIARIVASNAQPDDVDRARLAMHCLAGMWLGEVEREALYLGVLQSGGVIELPPGTAVTWTE